MVGNTALVAAGPADLLNGSFSLAAGSPFALAGLDRFADIAAGGSARGFDIVFDGGSLGTFSEIVTVSSFGSNAGGYLGPAIETTLVLRGTVVAVAAVPEPETYLLLSTGMLVLWVARRRNRRGEQR